MNLTWSVSRSDVRRVKEFMGESNADPRVKKAMRRRKERNLARKQSRVSRAAFWRALIAALLTSNQKSGRDSSVARFMRQRAFPLTYRVCRSQRNLAPFVRHTLKSFGGIRYYGKVGSQLEENLFILEDGMWADVLNDLNSLGPRAGRDRERRLANLLDETFVGLGPKQSRNLLQRLGFTRYEIPIDIRLTTWLNEFGFPIHITSKGLADRDYYEFVLGGVQRLCEAVGVTPYIFDAAVFASADTKAEVWR